MNQNRWNRLTLGTVLEHAGSGARWVVTENATDSQGRVIRRVLTRTVNATNPKEWKVVPASSLRPRPPRER